VDVLRRVVGRGFSAGLACLVCVLAVAGCAQFNKALGQRQALVSFKDAATVAQRLHVRSACAKLPNITAAPIATGVPAASATNVIVYTITPVASVADITRLTVCLNKFPALVSGLNLTDSTDNG
jgi:hypothetical protein